MTRTLCASPRGAIWHSRVFRGMLHCTVVQLAFAGSCPPGACNESGKGWYSWSVAQHCFHVLCMWLEAKKRLLCERRLPQRCFLRPLARSAPIECWFSFRPRFWVFPKKKKSKATCADNVLMNNAAQRFTQEYHRASCRAGFKSGFNEVGDLGHFLPQKEVLEWSHGKHSPVHTHGSSPGRRRRLE